VDIAVLTDIHGNHVALERCIEYAFSRNINTFFFLGMELCKEGTGNCIWPDIPEKYWEQAVNEMIGLLKR